MLMQLLIDSLALWKNKTFTNKIEIGKIDIISKILWNFQAFPDVMKLLNHSKENGNNENDSTGINSSIIDVSGTKNKNKETNENSSYIDVSIKEFGGIIYSSNVMIIGALVGTVLMIRSGKKRDNISESSIFVKELEINNILPEAINLILLQR